MIVVRARFDGRAFVPETAVNLPEGAEVEIVVHPTSPADGSGQSLLKKLTEIADSFPANPDLPTDLAAQHDYYLYGVPKRS
jgi:hypothetical protein